MQRLIGGTVSADRVVAFRLKTTVVEFVVGDIARETSDAIVNPAGPGMVDLAIRRAAGPLLLDAFHHAAHELPGSKLTPGHAVMTAGFDLPARNVVHCGPPVYADHRTRARSDLVSCHVAALRLARERALSTISFPAIGTGVYRYPVAEASEVAVTAVLDEIRAIGGLGVVRFVLFDRETLEAYSRVAKSLLAKKGEEFW